jgi:uncharacterized protein YijF (DUF1287 family)/L,D-peptidoglycan transpeptidase YkuD (ErfK/YbiS/YcfS/YnhG family)
MIARVVLAFGILALGGCRPEPQAKSQIDEPLGVAQPQPEPAEVLEPTVEQPLAEPEPALGVVDVGIFSDLDERVQIALPAELEGRLVALIDEQRSLLLLYADERPIKVYPLVENGRTLKLGGRTLSLRPGDHGELHPLASTTALRILAPGTTAPPGDRDRDGIPDPLDLNLGAIKTTLNADAYNQDYFTLPYPGGDVDRSLGACTDVIVRALRNAGIDLQVEVHEDILRRPRNYEMVGEPNRSIDHRRVRTLLPWFRAHWRSLDESAPLRPGDVVFMDTIEARKGPDHIGILGDRTSEGGRLLVANNWTDGYVTSFMDLLEFVEVTERFRMPVAPEHDGAMPAFATQAVVVRSPSWSSFRAQARRFERDTVNGEWRPIGDAFPVVLGHAGLGWGRGLHGNGGPWASGPNKQEGDGRSPAGVFAIGDAYGRKPTHATALPYQTESESLRCVDDPASQHYGHIIDADAVSKDWSTAEAMRRLYALAIVIEHNQARASAGGSCIFLHAWDGPDSPVTGCTAMATEQLDTLASWLEPGAVLVALPAAEYDRLRAAWSLPSWPTHAGEQQ